MQDIRPATQEDAAALGRIARAAYAPYLARLGFEPPPMAQNFPDDIAAGAVWVIGEPPLGYVVARPRDGDWLLENVARAPEASRGSGRRLIAFAEAEAVRRGFRRITLYTHALMTENHALYAKLGYGEIARREDAGLDRVFFAKRLG